MDPNNVMIIEWYESWYEKINGHENTYSLRFKIKVMFGHKLHYEIKVACGEISLKVRQTNWNHVGMHDHCKCRC